MNTETTLHPLKEPSRLRRILVVSGMMIASAAAGFLMTAYLFSLPTMDAISDLVPLWQFLVILVVGTLLALVLHEIGHLIGGILVGFRFALLIVGPLKIHRQGEEIRLGWNSQMGLFGGLAATYPTDTHNLVQRMVVVVAGGPAMSALTALFSALALTLLPPLQFPALWLFLLLLAFASAGVLLAVTIPGRASGFLSDRARLQALLSRGSTAQRQADLLAITALTMSGRRPRQWDQAVVERAMSIGDGSVDDLAAHLFAYTHWLDMDEVERAGSALDYVLARRGTLPEMMRPGLHLEAAFFTAYHCEDASTARAWLVQGKGGIVDAHNRLRAEAAVLLADGQAEAAAAKAAEGLAQIHRSSEPGSALAEADELRGILERAENRE
ncbi:MAG: hypothetical protein KF893_03730 [Caldilineaceae bacterium]|nr:hypothetical protein [Caldilineaceae bacterium]